MMSRPIYQVDNLVWIKSRVSPIWWEYKVIPPRTSDVHVLDESPSGLAPITIDGAAYRSDRYAGAGWHYTCVRLHPIQGDTDNTRAWVPEGDIIIW